MKPKNSTWFAIALAALCGCDDAVAGGGGTSITDSAAPVTRGDASTIDAAPPTVDCDEAPNGTPCGTPGSGKHCVLEACVENTCGDGIVVEEDNEECDDGNEDDGDGCSGRCDEEEPDAAAGEPRDAGADADAADASAELDASSDAGTGSDPDASTGADASTDAGASDDAGAHAGHDASTQTPADAGVTDAAVDAASHDHDAAAPLDAAPPQDAAPSQDAAPADAAPASDGSVSGPTCAACADTNCRAFQGADLVGGCFTAVNGDFGANTSDPNFIQDCIDTVACARQQSCGFSAQFQAADCYCGSSAGDVCTTSGPAADAKCRAQWQRATRTTTNAEVLMRMSDLAYPAGWAYYLIDCYRVSCNSTALGNCTVP